MIDNQHYYELELPPNGDLYKGELDLASNAPRGIALLFNRKAKLLIIGTISSGVQFDGVSVAYDFSDSQSTVIYYGHLKSNLKCGLGCL
jgi:hypothetical protein